MTDDQKRNLALGRMFLPDMPSVPGYMSKAEARQILKVGGMTEQTIADIEAFVADPEGYMDKRIWPRLAAKNCKDIWDKS